MIIAIKHDDAARDELHRQILIRTRQHLTRLPVHRKIAQPAFQTVPDGRQRSEQTDDSARRYGACADVENIAPRIASGSISLMGTCLAEAQSSFLRQRI